MINRLQNFLYIFVAFCFFSISNHAQILDKNENLVEAVHQIVKIFKPYLESIESCKDKIDEDKKLTITELNKIAQIAFLRPKGSERLSKEAFNQYQTMCSYLNSNDKEEIMRLFKEIGDLNDLYPDVKDPSPKYIVIQGSTVPDMRNRIIFLDQLIQDKKLKLEELTKIVFLVGERKLFDSETKDVLMNTAPYPTNSNWHMLEKDLPTDERQAAKMVWQQLDLSKELREHPTIFIEADKRDAETRAQTQDCVLVFLNQEKPSEGLYYVVSSNPFIDYQTRLTELKFYERGYKDNYVVKGLGPKIEEKNYPQHISIGVLMDNFARRLYVEQQFIELKQKNQSK